MLQVFQIAGGVEKSFLVRLGIALGLATIFSPWPAWPQTDSSAAKTLQDNLGRMIELGKAAEQFYRDSLVSRTKGGFFIPESPAWKISAVTAGADSSSLRAVIPGSSGGLILRIPEQISFLVPGATRLQVDSCKSVHWKSRGENAWTFQRRVEAGFELDCRVDAVGPLINYRLTVHSTGVDTLAGLTFFVACGLENWLYLAGTDSAGAGTRAKSRRGSFLSRLYFVTASGSVRAADLENGRADPERSVFPSGTLSGDFFSGLPASDFFRLAGLRPERLSGNSAFLNAVDRRWRLEVSSAPAFSFFYDPQGLSFGANPGLVRLAPGEQATLGGIIAINHAH